VRRTAPGTAAPSLVDLMSMDSAGWEAFSRGSPETGERGPTDLHSAQALRVVPLPKNISAVDRYPPAAHRQYRERLKRPAVSGFSVEARPGSNPAVPIRK
jgi:hypothetical protein